MNFTKEYKLSMYQDFGLIGQKEHIHLVRDKRDGKICVKKMMDKNQKDIIAFREICDSPYFPSIYEVVETKENLIIIEEYIEGVTLEEHMMGETLEEEQAINIARQICKALQYLHHADPVIVYRDLKAENIMVTRNGDVKLVDFNISREYQEGKKRDTVLLGTAEYAAPEQFGYFQTDNRTDIYAFGVLLNYMLTGKFPIDCMTQGKYSSLIRRCTELEPARRYQSVEEILQELGEQKEEDLQSKKVNKKIEESWMIPGFRSRKWWKVLLAVVGYGFLIYLTMTLEFNDGETGLPYPLIEQIIMRLALFSSQILTVFLSCNYRGISENLHIYLHRMWIVRAISYCVTSVVLLFVMVMIAALLVVIINPQ